MIWALSAQSLQRKDLDLAGAYDSTWFVTHTSYKMLTNKQNIKQIYFKDIFKQIELADNIFDIRVVLAGKG